MISIVDELINPYTGQWDEDLIRDVFSPVDVHRILQIPLNYHLTEDFVAWNYTRSGTFSVRSAYHKEFEHQHGAQWVRADGQGTENINPVWKDMWKLKIPGKIKHFAWKVLHGALPCFGVLANRHIPCSAQCPICLVGAEDIQHCLFKCRRATDVWERLGLLQVIRKAVAEDRSGSITMEILSKLQGNDAEVPTAELAVVAAWYIWWQRRQIVKGVKVQTPEKTALAIKVLATNFLRSTIPKGPIRKNDHMWRKPGYGIVKINVDASFQYETLSGACGAVARDYRGDFIAAASWFVPNISGVDSAELTAIRNGIYLATHIGCNNIEIESDCSFAVDSLNQVDDYLGPEVAIITECKQLMMDFASISFRHCYREANQVADELAKNSFTTRSSSSWDDEIPDFISHLLVNDMSII